MPKSHTPVMVVYGATSYTATTHMLPYLVSHADANAFHLILAGRNAEKLASLDNLLGPGTKREVVVLQLADEGGVNSLVKRADVVINLAGALRCWRC